MKLPVIVLSLLMLVGAGCMSRPTNQTPPAVNAPSEDISVSIDGAWELKTFAATRGAEQDVSSIGATMTVEPGTRLSAKICNSMSGEYDIEAGMLKVAALASTKMACEGLTGEVESAFMQGLSSGTAIEHGGDALVLRSAAGAAFSFGLAADGNSGEDRTYAGTVISIDLEHMKVDGPAEIVIRTGAGGEAKILVPSMGLNFCDAKASIADVYGLKVGQSVEARGSVGAETDSIVPCQSEAHYLRVVTK